MNQQRPHSDATDNERRASARFETHYAAQIGQPASFDALTAATIVDMSANGLCVEADCNVPGGARIEVEYYPNPGAAVEVVRGHVVHCEAVRPGRNRIGIRRGYDVRGMPVSAASDTPAATPPPSATMSPPSIPPPIPAQIRVIEKVDNGRSSTRRNTVLALAALAALVLLMFGIAPLAPERSGEPNGGLSAQSTPGSAPRKLFSLELGDVAIAVLEPEVVVTPVLKSIDAPDYSGMSEAAVLSHAQASMLSTAQPIDADEFEPLDAALANGAAERFIARLTHALNASARGDGSLAKTLLRDALEEPGTVGAVWLEAAEQSLVRMDSDATFRAEPLALDTLLEFSPQIDEPGADTPPLVVDIDTSAYTLTVLREGLPVRSFPIGLGRNGATPLGEFAIINKIRDPDWYDRGRSVSAGDPENPLGSRWMGLGQDGVGTGIGIHPTAEDDSVEQPQSRGCIRMQASDAEELFRMIPLGTPVEIHH